MSKRGISRRRFLAGSAAAGAVLAGPGLFSIGKSSAQKKGRVVILGFDGIEPGILEEMMAQGEAPNFKKLKDAGTFNRLGSTIPPQSPVAWTSFTTCKNP
ncbi:MAG: alkaline phosphatase family protein, partial [Candidatus Hydrogenedentes bacterium]|nr:alkaline phosphatase family protein [Candidatus Hydrogenedentota bacterium]